MPQCIKNFGNSPYKISIRLGITLKPKVEVKPMYGRATLPILAASGKEHPSQLDGNHAGNGGGQEQWIQRASELLYLLVSEISLEHEAASEAWFGQGTVPSEVRARQWSAYGETIEAAMQQGLHHRQDLLNLVDQAPASASHEFRVFANLLKENDSQLFFGDLLALGRELHQERRLPVFTQNLLQWCQLQDSTQSGAQTLLALGQGEAGLGAQLEYEGGHLFRELVNPLFLVPFGLASLSARGASLAVLSRASRWQGSTLLLSETAALAAEVPTLVLSRRLGLQMFAGGEGLWDGQSLSHEILATLGPFALLRGANNGFQLLTPRLQQLSSIQRASQVHPNLTRGLLSALRGTNEVGAVMGGHYLNGALGIEHLPENTSALFFSSLLTVGHMRLAGGIVERVNPFHIGGALRSQHVRLRSQTREDFHRALEVTPDHPLRPRLQAELTAAHPRLPWGDLTLARWTRRLEQGRPGDLATVLENRDMSLHALLVRPSRTEGPHFQDPMIFGWQLGFAGASASGRGLENPIHMMVSNDSKNQMGGTPREGSKSDTTPLPESAVRDRWMAEEIQRRVHEISQEAANDNSQTKLQNAAKKLSQIWQRYVRNPDKIPVDELSGELSQVREEIDAARSSGTKLQQLVQSLSLFVDQIRSQQSSAESSSSRPLTDQVSHESIVPEEPQNPLRRYVLNPLGKAFVGVRDFIKGRLQEKAPQENTEETSSGPDSESRLNLDEIAQEIARKEAQGETFEGAVRSLARLRKHLAVLARSQNLTPRWKSQLNEYIEQLAAYFPNLNWPRLGMEDLNSLEIMPGQEGALFGLAIRPDMIQTDSPLASRLRGVETFINRGDNRELELLHQSILFAAHYDGILSRFKTRIRPLAQEYGANESQTLVMRLTGESIANLMRNKWDLDSLLPQLQKASNGSPMESSLRSLEQMLVQETDLQTGLVHFGGKPNVESYFLTSLFVALRSRGDGRTFNQDLLPEALSYEREGFHPSIAVSLFGAARGRGELSSELFGRDFNPTAYLERAHREAQIDGE